MRRHGPDDPLLCACCEAVPELVALLRAAMAEVRSALPCTDCGDEVRPDCPTCDGTGIWREYLDQRDLPERVAPWLA